VTKPTKISKKPQKKVVKALNNKKTVPKVSAKKDVKKPAPKQAVKVPKKAAPKKVVSSGPKGYTSDQYQKFLSEKKRLESNSNQQLKDILRKNLQSMSGNKDDLIYKVADGIVLGRIPRCPNCFGGRPKFDFKAGTYYCSGYRDD